MAKESSIPIRCPHCKRWLSRSSKEHFCREATEAEVVGHLEGDFRDFETGAELELVVRFAE